MALAFAATNGVLPFEDMSASSGIRFVLQNNSTPMRRLPESMAGGVAAFDYNNDGRTALFFPGAAAAPALYRNEGSFRFTDVTADSGFTRTGFTIGAAAGDFDNDGNVDLFIAGYRDCRLYRNTGSKFQDVSSGSGIVCPGWSVAGAWVDYDRDGLLDLFVVSYLEYPETNALVCHDPSGRNVVYCNPRQFKGTANRLYRNLGNGRFEDVSASAGIAGSVGKGMSVAMADYDRDGW